MEYLLIIFTVAIFLSLLPLLLQKIKETPEKPTPKTVSEYDSDGYNRQGYNEVGRNSKANIIAFIT